MIFRTIEYIVIHGIKTLSHTCFRVKLLVSNKTLHIAYGKRNGDGGDSIKSFRTEAHEALSSFYVANTESGI